MTSTGDRRGADLDADRRAAVTMLRSALSGLATAGADDGSAVTVPSRRRGRGASRPECRTTRAALHDYLSGRLLPHRRRRLETHLDGCSECIRAFIDVREESWMLRDLGRHLVAADHRGGRHRRVLRRRVSGPRPARTPSTDGRH